jgi:secondary thiamine-phosphate synthase enzyme
MIYQDEFEVTTTKRKEVIDITDRIEKIVSKSKIENGICLIFLLHATAAIILEEDEPRLMKDIEDSIEKLFPAGAGYRHDEIDDNADAHLASGFIGQSRVYPIKDGKVVRGTWQHSLLVELDGPRRREVFVTVIGERS